jgi:hypothetical protein
MKTSCSISKIREKRLGQHHQLDTLPVLESIEDISKTHPYTRAQTAESVELSKAPMQAQTVDLMKFSNIHTDFSVLTKYGVNGELLSKLTAEDDVKS